MWVIQWNAKEKSWDVGYFQPGGNWYSHQLYPHQDANGDVTHGAKFTAEAKVHYLNGGV